MNRIVPALPLALVLALLAAGGCRPAATDAPATNASSPTLAAQNAPDMAAGTAPATDEAPETPGAAGGAAPAEASPPAAEAPSPADEAAAITQVVSNTFRAAMGVDDPEWQDVTVRQLSTDQLAELRGQPAAPADDIRVSRGYVWVVGFRTRLPVTLADLPADNPFDSAPDGPIDASLAGPDGLTSVYYVLGASQELGETRQYTLLSRGILGPDAAWDIADLAATGTAP